MGKSFEMICHTMQDASILYQVPWIPSQDSAFISIRGVSKACSGGRTKSSMHNYFVHTLHPSECSGKNNF